MPGMDLTGEWQEAKAGVPLADGEVYVVEFHGPAGTEIRAVDVEGAGPPTDAEARDALAHFNRDENPVATEALEFTARTGWTWWLKAVGASRLKVAKV